MGSYVPTPSSEHMAAGPKWEEPDCRRSSFGASVSPTGWRADCFPTAPTSPWLSFSPAAHTEAAGGEGAGGRRIPPATLLPP